MIIKCEQHFTYLDNYSLHMLRVVIMVMTYIDIYDDVSLSVLSGRPALAL